MNDCMCPYYSLNKRTLNVLTTMRCNAQCRFCFERDTARPCEASTNDLIAAINAVGAEEIGLVGGDPLVHPEINRLILESNAKDIYLTTNGIALVEDIGILEPASIRKLMGLNISIHAPSIAGLQKVFGREIPADYFIGVGAWCHYAKRLNPAVDLRIHCNLQRGVVDSMSNAQEMIRLAESLGVDTVRFVELQSLAGKDIEMFVDAKKDVFKNFESYSEALLNPNRDGCIRYLPRLSERVRTEIKTICPLTTVVKDFTVEELEEGLATLELLHQREVEGNSPLRVLYPDLRVSTRYDDSLTNEQRSYEEMRELMLERIAYKQSPEYEIRKKDAEIA